ncbi:MAG: adenylate/guanylate cyclase domain-containing protein [Leptolyngbyaceae cyanobacterium bins.59]|nr:adenylate/guanylate cyclase domain-containing protein [Leptolyngbyaceae cyanobacterium bins.59]
MLNVIKKQLWKWRGVLVAAPSIAVLIIGLRMVGLLQLLELAALDQLFLLRPKEPKDARILVVTITEGDVKKYGTAETALRDPALAKLLTTLQQGKPIAIGLDLYTNQRNDKALEQIFATTENLIAVELVADTVDADPIPAHPFFTKYFPEVDRVGANDLLADADGKLRRAMLSIDRPDQEAPLPSFALLMAGLYLHQQGITPELREDNLLQFGSVVLPAFSQNDGGYTNVQDRGYQTLLNYRGEMQDFDTVTVSEVLEKGISPALIRDRIVFIGTTAESFKDLFFTPYTSGLFFKPKRMPGVIIHANSASQIISAVLNQRPLLRTWSEPIEWLWILAWALLGATLSWQQRHQSGAARELPWILGVIGAGSILMGGSFVAFLYGWWIPVIPSLMALTGSAIAITGYVAQTADEMRRTFGRYLTDEVVANLLETPGGLKLGGERRKVTILISDLRGFSAIAERVPPEEVVKTLNLYLAVMADVIGNYQGTINEIMGDGILVIFGAPTFREDDAARAVACAIAMQLAMEGVNEQIQQMGLPVLQMGIGINTGEVIVGNIGSSKRAKYTVVGTPINLAARVESYTVGGQILISENTHKEVGPILQTDGEILVEAKGIKHPVTLYEISGIGEPYNLYRSKAEEAFVTLREELPVRYVLLEGKHAVGNLYQGSFMELSEQGALLKTDQPLERLNNLKMNLLNETNSPQEPEDLYAKVMKPLPSHPDLVHLTFTNVPPSVTAVLQKYRQSASEVVQVELAAD